MTIKLKHFIATSVLFALISACSSQQSAPSAKFDNGFVKTQTKDEWQQAFHKFHNETSIGDFGEYLDIIRSFDNVPSQQFCSEKSIKTLMRALQINPTSLMATSTLRRCATSQNKGQLIKTLADNTASIATHLIGDNNGQSIAHAIHVREVDEAYLILEIAGFDVLASELEMENDNFYYKIHSFDRLTGKFRYQYFTNYRFLLSIHKSAIGNEFTSQESIALTLESYREEKYAPIVIHDVRQLIVEGKLQQAERELAASEQGPLVAALRADLAVQANQPEILSSLIDQLLEHQQQGGIEAYKSLIFLLVKYAQTEEEFEQLDRLVTKLATLSSKQLAFKEVIGRLLSLPNPVKRLDNWWSFTKNTELLEPIANHFAPRLLAPDSDLPDNIDVLKFAAKQSSPSALFVLARYYLESPHMTDKPRGNALLQQSAKLGYSPALQYQTVQKDKM